MKRLQILIDEDLDAALARTSAQTGRSKAALIREFVRDRLRPLPPLSADPLWRMAGSDSFEPASVDDVVYAAGASGRGASPRARTAVHRRRRRAR